MATLDSQKRKEKRKRDLRSYSTISSSFVVTTKQNTKMKTTDFSSSSSSDRRIGALLRHLTAGSDSDHLSSVYASPTSGVTGGSVFAHLVQAPEDPILGVPSFPLL